MKEYATIVENLDTSRKTVLMLMVTPKLVTGAEKRAILQEIAQMMFRMTENVTTVERSVIFHVIALVTDSTAAALTVARMTVNVTSAGKADILLVIARMMNHEKIQGLVTIVVKLAICRGTAQMKGGPNEGVSVVPRNATSAVNTTTLPGIVHQRKKMWSVTTAIRWATLHVTALKVLQR